MSVNFEGTINDLRDSWQAQLTTADQRWPLRQLHGLYDMLNEHHDELIKALVEDCPSIAIVSYERELAQLIGDIVALIDGVETAISPKSKSKAQATRFGTVIESLSPKGMSLIISNSNQPFRFAIAPFAASIAARNAVALISTEPSRFFKLCMREFRKFLDASTLYIGHTEVYAAQVEESLFDHILIIEDDTSKWSSLLSSPVAFHCPVYAGFHVAVIGEDRIDIEKTAKMILSKSAVTEPEADAWSAVFVHKEHASAISDALSSLSSTKVQTYPSTDETPQLGPYIYTIKAASIGLSRMKAAMHEMRGARGLLLVEVSSMDQVIDATRMLKNLQQLVLLGSPTREMTQYIKTWTDSAVFSVGSSLSFVPPFLNLPFTTNSTIPMTSFPVSFFSRSRLVALSPGVDNLLTVEDLRKSWQANWKPLRAEHPGGRVDFFVQVEYAVKAAAGVVGVCSLVGIWFGARSLHRRFL